MAGPRHEQRVGSAGHAGPDLVQDQMAVPGAAVIRGLLIICPAEAAETPDKSKSGGTRISHRLFKPFDVTYDTVHMHVRRRGRGGPATYRMGDRAS